MVRQKAVCPHPRSLPSPAGGAQPRPQRAVGWQCHAAVGLLASVCQDWAQTPGCCPSALPGWQGDVGVPRSPHPTSQVPLRAGYRKQHFSDPVAPSQRVSLCPYFYTCLCMSLCVLPCVSARVYCPVRVAPPARRAGAHAGAHSHSGGGGTAGRALAVPPLETSGPRRPPTLVLPGPGVAPRLIVMGSAATR